MFLLLQGKKILWILGQVQESMYQNPFALNMSDHMDQTGDLSGLKTIHPVEPLF